jgi:hypothetical protein
MASNSARRGEGVLQLDELQPGEAWQRGVTRCDGSPCEPVQVLPRGLLEELG